MKCVDYVCNECADAHGGVWPDGHVATFHQGECDQCGLRRALCSVDDYDWPNNKPRGWRGGGRD